jgi:cobyrinic acid a,c-diamide synthase
MVTIPRLVVAAAASSAGKTTIATGLMGALRAAGHDVAGFKVGPDFIDPGYHALATGRPGRNLDAVLTSEELVPRLFLHGAGRSAALSSRATAEPERSLRSAALSSRATAEPERSLRSAALSLRRAARHEGPPTLPELQESPADIAIVEGVMGLFDGQLGRDGFGSTAHIARLVDAPVLLVVDAAGSSRTAAAAALGLRAFDLPSSSPGARPGVFPLIAGVIVNRVASSRHAAELAAVFERAGLPVLGMVPRNAGIAAPSRHLGLVPAAERDESAATVAALAAHVAEHVDLDAVRQLAAAAPGLDTEPWDPTAAVTPVTGRPVVGVMAGRAFTFRYAETEELLRAAGCTVVEIDPLRETELPAGIAGLYIGGGFPEVHAIELSRNAGLRRAIADAVRSGLPTVAECAGQLYLGEHLDGHPMVGVLPASARMTPRLTLGYRSAVAPSDTLLARAGEAVTGHEFHRTQTVPRAGGRPAWRWAEAEEGFSLDPADTGAPTLHSSYLHLHWAGQPGCAQRFAEAAAGFAWRGALRDADHSSLAVGSSGSGKVTVAEERPRDEATRATVPEERPRDDAARATVPEERPRDDAASRRADPQADGIDLHHHGDHDVAPGLVDLAVNVMLPGPPSWLAEVIGRTIPGLGAYPDAREARQAIAAAHGVPPEMVLPTAGGAEAFALIARTLGASHPLVVHPQFTEPEATLRAAGHAVQRWLLPVTADSAPPPLADLPSWADALFVGNPTNPTGWLHRHDHLLAAGEGRLLVVDEAFMDATDEAESLIGPQMPNRLVLRSLSKTWGLAGLRVGYVVGDPALIARLENAQPAWPLSAPAIAAIVATNTPTALAEARERYASLPAHRAHLATALAAAGFTSIPSAAPFVLIDTSPCGPASVRVPLAAAGFAVRRGESFPGLTPAWIRVRVPEPAVADRFVAALATLRLQGPARG